jgi:hypothetical protein
VKRWVISVLLLFCTDSAEGGAWTLNRNHIAVFAGVTASTAPRLYDSDGGSSKRIVFSKYLFQSWMEYGLLDSVTLFAVPEYVLAKSDMDGTGVADVRSASIEGGLRILLLSRIGMLSVQTSVKSAGAFDMSTSASGEAGRQFETRLLYGRSFKLFKHDAFLDIEMAKRWIARPRPDEIAFEGTAGYWMTREYLVTVQSFNFMTTGPVRPPYRAYELSKLQVSLVQKLSRRWSFQTGYFMSLFGRNIVKESGMVATLWYQA